MIKVYANNDKTAEQLSLNYSNDLILALHSVYSHIDQAYNIGIGDNDTNHYFYITYKNDDHIVTRSSRQDNTIPAPKIDLSLANNETKVKKEVFEAFINILNKKINNDKQKNKNRNDDDDKLSDIENKLYDSY